VKDQVTEIYHVTVLVKAVVQTQVYYDKKLYKLLSMIDKWCNLHVNIFTLGELDSPAVIIYGQGTFLYNQGGDRRPNQDRRQPDQAMAMLGKEEQIKRAEGSCEGSCEGGDAAEGS
jgi:hypothetical protein